MCDLFELTFKHEGMKLWKRHTLDLESLYYKKRFTNLVNVLLKKILSKAMKRWTGFARMQSVLHQLKNPSKTIKLSKTMSADDLISAPSQQFVVGKGASGSITLALTPRSKLFEVLTVDREEDLPEHWPAAVRNDFVSQLLSVLPPVLSFEAYSCSISHFAPYYNTYSLAVMLALVQRCKKRLDRPMWGEGMKPPGKIEALLLQPPGRFGRRALGASSSSPVLLHGGRGAQSLPTIHHSKASRRHTLRAPLSKVRSTTSILSPMKSHRGGSRRVDSGRDAGQSGRGSSLQRKEEDAASGAGLGQVPPPPPGGSLQLPRVNTPHVFNFVERAGCQVALLGSACTFCYIKRYSLFVVCLLKFLPRACT